MDSNCHYCGTPLLNAARGRPKRYCSDACRLLAFREARAEPCNEIPGHVDPCNEIPATGTLPSHRSTDLQAGPTPGALQGDDYPLEYYPDGYPKLPACLDRRAQRQQQELENEHRTQEPQAA
jgi:hypothetical protein